MFTDKIKITKKSGESLLMDQRRVRIRQNQNGLMAVSYVAPVFDVMDLEDFFSDLLTSEKVMIDISGTGDFRVGFRGIVEGKDRNFPQNLDHRIVLLQKPTCLDNRENIRASGFSKFRPRGKISN